MTPGRFDVETAPRRDRLLESISVIVTLASRSAFSRFRDRITGLFTVATDDVDLVRAQYRAFIQQIPVLYFILAVNALAVVWTFVRFGHPILTLYLPATMCLFTFGRGIWWARRRHVTVSDAQALRYLRTTNRLSFFITTAFSTWGLVIYPLGDAYAQGQIVFFLSLTMISCVFCLVHLRATALIVWMAGVVPFVTYFLCFGRGHFTPAAVNLALVAVGVVFMVMTYSREFIDLVISRRDLARQNEETRRLSAENLRIANVDALTGLPNRRALMARLEQHQQQAIAPDRPTAVLFVDLDGFKDVNDTYGHEVGDKLLKIVAKDFEAHLPSGALLARLGGDEFAVLISAPGVEDIAVSIAHALIDCLREPLHIGERTIQVGASVGVAWAWPLACSASELMRQADVAMYQVKAAGKANVIVYTPALDAERQRRQDIEDDIEDGLKRGEFEVEYQPIVDAATRQRIGVEALLRWPRRPDGPIGPDEFIPIAESSGLIHALGQFVLRRACSDLLDRGDLKLSVNVSPAQFRDPCFESRIRDVLAETGFPPHRLELEVTEGYLIHHPARATAAINALKAMGIAVALDDFGTGYTSIAYLQTYGFSRIKIDKSLVDGIGVDHKSGVLISGIVFLAQGLNLAVTAEGIESEDQAKLLRLAGCQNLQGFHFGRPVSRDALERPADDAQSQAG